MKRIVSILVGMGFFMAVAYAQDKRNCGTMDYMKHLERKNPSMLQRLNRIERHTGFHPKKAASALRIKRDVITVPVVVHVVYHSEAQNISDQQIRSQIRVLNEDYRRKNADAYSTPSQFRKLAADTGIEFVLATQDPAGNPTSGITRTYTSRESFISFENGVKYNAKGGKDAWPSDQYMNIWVCNLAMGVLGYAQFPGGPSQTDGVVIGYRYFGTIGNLKKPFNFGRTTTHEVGHYLNLRHIWGDGPCGHDDFVQDTPEAAGPTHGCIQSRSTCGSLDMTSNFMDYTDDACMNMFTKGQSSRMRSLFSPGGAREKLLYSPALDPVEVPVAVLAPGALEAINVTSRTATLTWNSVSQASGYQVRFRPLKGIRWQQQQFASGRDAVRLVKLPSCTDFEFQVRTVYKSSKSNYSSSTIFSTGGCEETELLSLAVLDVQPNQARITWTPIRNARQYFVQYKRVGSQQILTRKAFGNTSLVLTNLIPGSMYKFRVKAYVPGESRSYSRVKTFYTPSSLQVARLNRQASAKAAQELPTSYLTVSESYDAQKLRIKLTDREKEPVGISLTDVVGNEVLAKAIATSPNRYEIDTRHLLSGPYHLLVEDSQGFIHQESVRVRQ
ncbi:MAG: fibronectin type III domain-containing protein [Bacteroidota bacterium]